jgi:hypothetical protein
MALLKNFIVWTGLALLALLAAIWFTGPLVGLTRVDLRVFIALVLIVVWVILIFLKKHRRGSGNCRASGYFSSGGHAALG